MVDEDGSPKYADYEDYIINHERKPGIGPLAGFRGNGEKSGRGEPNPGQLEAYKANGAFWHKKIPEEGRYYKMANMAYQEFAVEMGICETPQPYAFQIYSETLQKFRLAAEGHGDIQPPEHLRPRIKTCFTPLPTWYPPFEGEVVSDDEYPIHALTQRPMAMYHSWGSQNPWLRQIHGHNPMFIPQGLAEEHDLSDGDWIWVTSHHGKIRVPVAIMAGLNEKTIWTWNAIGKRKGAWQLEEDAPEAKKGFLLNHLIKELLPAQADGQRWSNSDPITGQAAWFDLKVKIAKADPSEPAISSPQFSALPRMNAVDPEPVKTLQYGLQWTANDKKSWWRKK
jgi:anaerobic selenocysteine-containing dehydrogenase